jgi:hypothetical protein
LKRFLILLFILFLNQHLSAQNYSFDFNSSGRRVCLVSSEINLGNKEVKILFLDSLDNSIEPIFVYRRELGTTTWTSVASALPAGTGHWIDNNVNLGDTWEYQVKKQNTWYFNNQNYDAVGYTVGILAHDNTNYKGQMILLVSNDIPNNLSLKYNRLKKELTADGWFVNELIVPRATNWNSGNEVVSIKNQILTIYNTTAANDKPKALFILGHVPLPRSGSLDILSPDNHTENRGARGCDAYYADIDGVFTDIATYNPGGLSTPLAVNLPGDFKWDQDFFPSDIEMAFGRIDFADITDILTPEMTMIENYLDRLSKYKNVVNSFNMGEKLAFFSGYDNSNDGSFRSLMNISKPDSVYQNYAGANHNQWVQNNGPFKIYMQNTTVPAILDWQNYGMNATVYTSDQSHWGFGDVPQTSGEYSRIRALLGIDSKCLIAFTTTMGMNIFHQACSGKPLGIAMKEIMNHNQTNQYLEKPPQEYDTENWWNRTHFAFYGDPTLSLYQILPPSNFSINEANDQALLQWTASSDANVIGYHIYESNTELGKFQRITANPLTTNSYVIPDYVPKKWYMVKSVKMIESGCGKFLHSSIGLSIEDNLTLGLSNQNDTTHVKIYPNPSNNKFNITSRQIITSFVVYNAQGSKIELNRSLNQQDFIIDCSAWSNGIYFMKFKTIDGKNETVKLLKSN